MRILFIYHDHGHGGVQRHILTLMTGLRAAGHETVFAGPGDSWLAKRCRRNGIITEPVSTRGLFDLFSHILLAWLVHKYRIDIVHGHARRSAFYAFWAGRLTHRPSLCTAHSTDTWKHLDLHARVIAVSDAVSTYLLQHAVSTEQLVTIHNGVPAQQTDIAGQRTRTRTRLGFNTHTLAIGIAARFIRDKGQDVLVDAFAQIAANTPQAQLVFIGETTGAWHEEIRSRVSTLMLEQRVHFLGYQEDVPPLLAALDIFVMPSRREAISLALLEAASMGLALVGARTGGIPEVIEDGQTGLLFESGNATELEQKLTLLIRDSALRRFLGQNALVRWREHFSDKNMVTFTERVYLEIINRSRPFSNRP